MSEDETITTAARQTLELYFMSEDTSYEIIFEFSEHSAPAIIEFLLLFGDVEEQTITLNSTVELTENFKRSVATFVQKHSQNAPSLKAFEKFIERQETGTFNFVLPEKPPLTSTLLELEVALKSLNQREGVGELIKLNAGFAELLKQYNLSHLRTDRETVIGKKSKPERRCRFCSKTMNDGATFNSAAHAIPRAFGNKHLKVADECDDCNNYFGTVTEPSLVAYMDIQRVYLGLRGRSKNDGLPKIKYEKGQLHHDGTQLKISGSDMDINPETGEATIRLGKGSKFVPADVYRALVKIVLSVVSEETLTHLSKTIGWVRYGSDDEVDLPPAWSSLAFLPNDESAQIAVYERISEMSDLPHIVGEFRMGCFVNVFVVPFSDRDDGELEQFFETEEFKGLFSHYSKAKSWRSNDFSSKAEKKIVPTLHFKHQNSGESNGPE